MTAKAFDEFAAALQLPYYFGKNWPAFDECLCDLEWVTGDRPLVLVMHDAQHVLADEPVELSVLVDCSSRAREVCARPIELGESWDRPAMRLGFVLHAGDHGDVRLARWRAAGARTEALGPLTLAPRW